MIKYPVTILLILLVGLQTFSKWCLIIEYQVNKDFIAKNLCINRAKPSCCCQGKCYLTKKLTTDESQQQTPGKGGQKEETSLQFISQQTRLPQPVFIEMSAIHSTRYLAPASKDHSLSPFEPPQL